MRTTDRSRGALVFGILFFVVGSFAAIASWRSYLLDTSIVSDDQRAEGRVVRKSVGKTDGLYDYVLEYSFTPQGSERLSASRSVSKEAWNTLHEGDSIEVVYSSENPRHNFPLDRGGTSLGLTIFVSLTSTVVAALGALAIAGCFSGNSDEA